MHLMDWLQLTNWEPQNLCKTWNNWQEIVCTIWKICQTIWSRNTIPEWSLGNNLRCTTNYWKITMTALTKLICITDLMITSQFHSYLCQFDDKYKQCLDGNLSFYLFAWQKQVINCTTIFWKWNSKLVQLWTKKWSNRNGVHSKHGIRHWDLRAWDQLGE